MSTALAPVTASRRTATVRLVRDRVSLRVNVRALVTGMLLLGIAVAAFMAELASGDLTVPLGDVWATLTGTDLGFSSTVILDWRLPRALLAAVFGAALGFSGGIFQSMTRNPLGSPDVIGFDSGAFTGALVVILLVHGDYLAVAGGALAGGLVTAFAVYLLAFVRGAAQGFRLIMVGIALSTMLASANTYLVMKADYQSTVQAALWGNGSLNGLGWAQVQPVLVVAAVLFPAAIWLTPQMRVLEMGDDAARALGVRAEVLRRRLIVVGVALTALVTAAAGPISFVALAAPQLARLLNGGRDVSLVPAALMGAAVLLVSDWVAQHALGVTLPVGVVTVSVGGLYLIGMLAAQARRQI